MCGALGVSRGGFYAWLTRPRSRRSQSEEELGAKVRASYSRPAIRLNRRVTITHRSDLVPGRRLIPAAGDFCWAFLSLHASP
jgi:hypothetical protein